MELGERAVRVGERLDDLGGVGRRESLFEAEGVVGEFRGELIAPRLWRAVARLSHSERPRVRGTRGIGFQPSGNYPCFLGIMLRDAPKLGEDGGMGRAPGKVATQRLAGEFRVVAVDEAATAAKVRVFVSELFGAGLADDGVTDAPSLRVMHAQRPRVVLADRGLSARPSSRATRAAACRPTRT